MVCNRWLLVRMGHSVLTFFALNYVLLKVRPPGRVFR